ncbi:MAG: hypothetical protein OXK76_06610 [Gammaproteobacteria bacterium]|nr:hypothetical protein [Gammaproteobacteria bacterium]
MTGFDKQAALDFSTMEDRDLAPFFAGRDDEIRRFDEALRNAKRGASVFRVYQGAPGCGKTSLLNRLMDIRSDVALFIDLGPDDFVSDAALVGRVGREIGPPGDNGIVGFATRTAARKPQYGAVVLYMDEAQVIAPSAEDGLRRLNTTGLGIPSVCLFVGLSHTQDRLREAGISRLSQDAVVNMGAMDKCECAGSVKMLLDEFGAGGDDEAKEAASAAVAEYSHGWPQHLFSAQKALSGELVRTNGSLSGVDWKRVREESDHRRYEYYAGRLSGAVLGSEPSVTAAIVAKAQEGPTTHSGLIKLCRRELERAGLLEDPDLAVAPTEFARMPIERGVLSIVPDSSSFAAGNRYAVAIPSLAEWISKSVSLKVE